MKWARLDFPPEFLLGLRGLATVADWRIRESADGALVTTSERYDGREASLIRAIPLATANTASDPHRYELLTRWQPQDSYRHEDVVTRVRQLREIREPTSLTDAFVSLRLQLMTIPDAAVPNYVREQFGLIAVERPDASLWAIELAPALRWRVASVRILFGAGEHPDVLATLQGSPGRIPTPSALLPSLGFGLDAFVEPALLACSPWMIGINGIRVGGQIVILFGQPLPGFTGNQADQPLDVLRGRSPLAASVPRPETSTPMVEAWLSWWIRRLNALLDRALDVAAFVDENGRYDPGLHLGVLASLERLFAGVQGILANAHRRHDRVRRLFEVIDLLEGLSYGSWESMLRPDRLDRQLTKLRTTLPPEIQPIALTRVLPALDALIAFGDEFRKGGEPGFVATRSSSGARMDLTIPAATQAYLRLIRNAGTHSFRKALRDPHLRSVLAAHPGDVPDAIADLAWFHLLRFLVEPRLSARP